MTASLRKEFRPLLLPWGVAVGCVALASVLSQIAGAGEFESFLIAISKLTFPGALILLASSSFGSELQQHTLPLLLSQPVGRTRLWAEKMFVLVVSIGTAMIAAAVFLVLLSLGRMGEPLFETKEAVLFGIFLLGTICSCGFWTLVAGSSIGGFVFTVAGQFITAAAVAGTIAWIHGEDQAFEDSKTFPVLAVAGLVYSALFLWLGWRKFVRLEVRSIRPGQTLAPSGITNWKFPWAGMFVSRPSERVRNLIRKELRLERPIFLLAAIFVVCWLATASLQWLRPKQNIIYLFDVLTCLYAPLAALLAGCVPLGEEKALGLTASQLSLPFSQRLQFFIKLAVAAGTATALCLVLPLVLFWATRPFFDISSMSGLMNAKDNGILALGALCGLAFLSAYWAISMVANTVRAALVGVCGLIAFGACAAFGIWLGQESSGLETGPLVAIMCRLQLSPELLREQATTMVRFMVFGMGTAIILLSLWQAFLQFRKSEHGRRILLLNSLTLAAVIVSLSFWSVDILSSAGQLPNALPVRELRRALNHFAWTDPRTDQPHYVSTQELQARVSKQTAIWLRNAAVSYQLLPASERKNGEIAYDGSVRFPGGAEFRFNGGYLRGQEIW